MSNFYQERVLPVITWCNDHTRLTPDHFHRGVHFALGITDRLFPNKWGLVEKFTIGGERFSDEHLNVNFMGIEIDHPFGIGGGWDKTGFAARGLYRLGAGWVTVGGIKTIKEKANNGPLLWVDRTGGVAQNHYGMPSPGAEKVVENIKLCESRGKFPIFANLALPRLAKPDEAPEIFANLIKILCPLVDLIEINLSCPNQDDRKKIQNVELAEQIIDQAHTVMSELGITKPLSIKIAPPFDISWDDLSGLVDLAIRKGVGISAFNTTTDPGIKAKYGWMDMKGGISGADCDYQNRTTQGIAFIYNKSRGKVPVIGLGGINTPEQAMAKIRAGATLVGGVTAFRSEGTYYPGKITRGLAGIVHNDPDHRRNIGEFVGIDMEKLYGQIRRDGFSISVK